MKYVETIDKITTIFDERDEEYGDFTRNLIKAAQIASAVIGHDISAWDIAMIMHCIKLSRLERDNSKAETYNDCINYQAFASDIAESE